MLTLNIANTLAKSVEMMNAGAKNHFPSQLHRMLTSLGEDHDELNRIVSWQPHGRCFFLHSQDAFSRVLLPKWFPRLKYPSFQRQLHKHGFRRLHSQGPDKGAYYHLSFVRGYPDLARDIQPLKGSGKRGRKPQSTEPNFYTMSRGAEEAEEGFCTRQNDEDSGCQIREGRHRAQLKADTELPAQQAGARPQQKLRDVAQGTSTVLETYMENLIHGTSAHATVSYHPPAAQPGAKAFPSVEEAEASKFATTSIVQSSPPLLRDVSQSNEPGSYLGPLSTAALPMAGPAQQSSSRQQSEQVNSLLLEQMDDPPTNSRADTASNNGQVQTQPQGPPSSSTSCSLRDSVQQAVEADQLQQQIQLHSRQVQMQLIVQQQLESQLQLQIYERQRRRNEMESRSRHAQGQQE